MSESTGTDLFTDRIRTVPTLLSRLRPLPVPVILRPVGLSR